MNLDDAASPLTRAKTGYKQMLPIINNNRLDRTDRCTISPTSYTSTGHLSRQAAGEERGLLRLVRHETRPADQLEPIDCTRTVGQSLSRRRLPRPDPGRRQALIPRGSRSLHPPSPASRLRSAGHRTDVAARAIMRQQAVSSMATIFRSCDSLLYRDNSRNALAFAGFSRHLGKTPRSTLTYQQTLPPRE